VKSLDRRGSPHSAGHAASSAVELTEQLLAPASEFCGAQFQDDATLVVVAVN